MSKLKITILGKTRFRDTEALRLIRLAARESWKIFKYPFDGQVDITVTDDEGIREINRDYREVDSATDVLSFPLNEFEEGKAPDDINMAIAPDINALPLGDMIISVERAKAQGEEYGHGFSRECAYLTVHSMLHLLGYDHMDEGPQKAAMREKEEEVLALLGLERK